MVDTDKVIEIPFLTTSHDPSEKTWSVHREHNRLSSMVDTTSNQSYS